MKVIVNKEQKDLTFSFEGNDYTFIAGKAAQVEDNLYAHLQELVPLAFDFEPNLSKIKTVAEISKVETHSVFPGGKFGVQSADVNHSTPMVVDETPKSGNVDKDGIEFFGPGLESDSS